MVMDGWLVQLNWLIATAKKNARSQLWGPECVQEVLLQLITFILVYIYTYIYVFVVRVALLCTASGVWIPNIPTLSLASQPPALALHGGHSSNSNGNAHVDGIFTSRHQICSHLQLIPQFNERMKLNRWSTP